MWQGEVCMAGGMHSRGHAWQGHGRQRGVWPGGWVCVAGETATAADDTQPYGLHSCVIIVMCQNNNNSLLRRMM